MFWTEFGVLVCGFGVFRVLGGLLAKVLAFVVRGCVFSGGLLIRVWRYSGVLGWIFLPDLGASWVF